MADFYSNFENKWGDVFETGIMRTEDLGIILDYNRTYYEHIDRNINKLPESIFRSFKEIESTLKNFPRVSYSSKVSMVLECHLY